ncbi:MAG TPA: hypothetical protein VD772_04620, partial [Anseongella sp.]|nr:hypothetical protein [Anseongella sp.]
GFDSLQWSGGKSGGERASRSYSLFVVKNAARASVHGFDSLQWSGGKSGGERASRSYSLFVVKNAARASVLRRRARATELVPCLLSEDCGTPPTCGLVYWIYVVNPSKETFATPKQHLESSAPN